MSEFIDKALPEGAPFGPQQTFALNAVLRELTSRQAAWLSGYLGGLAQISVQTADSPLPVPGAKVAEPSLQSEEPVPVTILYGTESGNAQGLAEQLRGAASREGFAVNLQDMADYPKENLAREKHLLVVVSTWGEGDPPETARDFHEFVLSESAPKLSDTAFAVFALGDTSYPDFCECGKQLDQRLAALGGNRILDRVDSDVEFEQPFADWQAQILAKLTEITGGGTNGKGSLPERVSGEFPALQAAPQVIVSTSEPAEVSIEPYGKKNPFLAPVKTLINLNGRGSAKATYHVELGLQGSGFTYKPGDVAGIIPANCPEVVEDLVRMAGFRGDELIERDGETYSLTEWLEDRCDITSLNPNLMKKYVPFAKNKQLDRFLEPENKAMLSEWLWGRELRDLFVDFPPADSLTVDQLLGMLRKMPPRLYSIASSLRAHPNEVHLTVGVVKYESHGRKRKGVCSSFLGERIEEGSTVKTYIHANKNFFLPENGDTPIIMVGPGTGIAPFRAFVEERVALGCHGPSWLFFGDQHFATDFLYQTEWQKYLKSGALSRMDVAFSRDTDRKIYVQHRMKEKAADLWKWLEEGAYFYVCGDASRMAKDVHQALLEIAVEQGGKSEEAAEVWIKELQKSKRYQRDVY